MTRDEGSTPCPICFGTGWQLEEGDGTQVSRFPSGELIVYDKGVRFCECQQKERTRQRMTRARIPLRFKDCTLDSFRVSDESHERALAITRRFVEEYPVVEAGLHYQGDCGVGKTHLAIAALKALILKGIDGLFYDSRDLLKEIQDSYNPSTHTSELEILAPIFDAEVLVLDELGATKPTEWVMDTLTQIINKRYNDTKITIFTSNYPDVRTPVYDETLANRVGVRFRSRLYDMCRSIRVEGKDYRRWINERRAPAVLPGDR